MSVYDEGAEIMFRLSSILGGLADEADELIDAMDVGEITLKEFETRSRGLEVRHRRAIRAARASFHALAARTGGGLH